MRYIYIKREISRRLHWYGRQTALGRVLGQHQVRHTERKVYAIESYSGSEKRFRYGIRLRMRTTSFFLLGAGAVAPVAYRVPYGDRLSALPYSSAPEENKGEGTKSVVEQQRHPPGVGDPPMAAPWLQQVHLASLVNHCGVHCVRYRDRWQCHTCAWYKVLCVEGSSLDGKKGAVRVGVSRRGAASSFAGRVCGFRKIRRLCT